MWHGLSGPAEPPAILEVWNRAFLSISYKHASAAGAEVYNVCIRVPVAALASLMTCCGQGCLYFEPRGHQVDLPSDLYTVVWVPKASFQENPLLGQQHAEATGLVRVANRYGFRCLTNDGPKLHNKLEPDCPYLPSGSTRTFQVRPLRSARNALPGPQCWIPSFGRLSRCKSCQAPDVRAFGGKCKQH